jgi:hypothetical protein
MWAVHGIPAWQIPQTETEMPYVSRAYILIFFMVNGMHVCLSWPDSPIALTGHRGMHLPQVPWE